MNKLKIYTTAYCSSCKGIKHMLNSEGIPYEELDAQKNIELLKSHNVLSLPVIECDGEFMHGTVGTMKQLIDKLKKGGPDDGTIPRDGTGI